MKSVVIDRSERGYSVGICFEPSAKKKLTCLYSSFLWAELEESGSVRLMFTHHEIKLRGEKLDKLVDNIGQQRVSAVRVVPRSELAESDDPVVREMVVTPL